MLSGEAQRETPVRTGPTLPAPVRSLNAWSRVVGQGNAGNPGSDGASPYLLAAADRFILRLRSFG
jgi:hypothetical protein